MIPIGYCLRLQLVWYFSLRRLKLIFPAISYIDSSLHWATPPRPWGYVEPKRLWDI